MSWHLKLPQNNEFLTIRLKALRISLNGDGCFDNSSGTHATNRTKRKYGETKMSGNKMNQREKYRPNGQQPLTLSLPQWRWVVLRRFLQIERGHMLQAVAKGALRHDLLGSLGIDNAELIRILREIDDEIEGILISSLRQGDTNDD